MESISCLQHLNAQGDIITKSFLNNDISTTTHNNNDDDSNNGHDDGSIDGDIYLTHSCINIKQQYHHPHHVVDHVISIQLPSTPDYIMRLADLMDLIVTNQLYLLPTGYRHHSTVDGSSSSSGGGNSTSSSTNNNNNNNYNYNNYNSTDDKINHDSKNDDNDKYAINIETPSVFRTINKETNETFHGNGHISPHIPSQTTTNSSNTVTFTPMSEYIQHIKETASVNKNYYESIKTSTIPSITTTSTTTSIAIPPFTTTTTTTTSSTIVNNDDSNRSINISDNNISNSNSYVTPTILTQIAKIEKDDEYDRDDENSQIKNLEVFFNSLDDELNSLLTSGNNVTNDKVVSNKSNSSSSSSRVDGHVTNISAESSSNNNNYNNDNSSNPDNKQSTHYDEDNRDTRVDKIEILVNSHASISEESSAIVPSLHPSSIPHTQLSVSSEEAKPSKKSLSTNIQVMIVMMMMMMTFIV